MGRVPRQQITSAAARGARRLLAACCGGLALLLGAAACGGAGRATVGSTPVSGGTATYAQLANNSPDYIYPFDGPSDFSVANTNYFQYLMYRPLYWFGKGREPLLNTELSLASPPVYKGHTVTITMKDYKWSNGEQVTAQDVVFWIHLLQAVGVPKSASQPGWGGYVQGEFPDNVTGVRAVSTSELTMRIKSAKFSQPWFTSNELSQISPLPMAWDRTASGTSNCAAVLADCAAVNAYLLAQASTSPSTWASSPVWSVIDGPWRLKSFTSQSVATFSYNHSYSGRVPAHHITGFQEVPFSSEEAEYNVLQAGGVGNQKIDVGYLPTVDAPFPPAGQAVGQNPLAGYKLTPLYAWGLNYFPYNFVNTTGQGAIFSQPYFRQAFQSLMDQAGVINGPLHGYGQVTVGPVASYPVTRYLSATGRQGDPFPYSPSTARGLLASNGWSVQPNGVTRCTRPGAGAGQCGPHIASGAQLSFTIDYATGVAWMQSELRQLQSNAAQVGITLTLRPGSFNDVIDTVTSCGGGPYASRCHNWQMADWGQGWSYSPDFLPTGEELFMTGASSNYGQYSDQKNDSLIDATLKSSSLTAMYNWQDYLSKQAPVVYQPQAPSALVEAADNLRIGPVSPTLSLNPENWYFVK